MNDFSLHIREPYIASTPRVSEALMVDADEVEDGGMEIPNGLWLVHYAVSVFVRGAVNRSGLDACAG